MEGPRRAQIRQGFPGGPQIWWRVFSGCNTYVLYFTMYKCFLLCTVNALHTIQFKCFLVHKDWDPLDCTNPAQSSLCSGQAQSWSGITASLWSVAFNASLLHRVLPAAEAEGLKSLKATDSSASSISSWFKPQTGLHLFPQISRMKGRLSFFYFVPFQFP